MESGVVSFVNLTQKPTSCTLHAYMQERIQVVKPNAELYTRQYSSFSQTLQFSLPPRRANFSQLWGLNFIYLKMKKVMVFALYFKRKTETMERRRKKKTKQIILSLFKFWALQILLRINPSHQRGQNSYKEQSTCIYSTLHVRKPYNSSECTEAIP